MIPILFGTLIGGAGGLAFALANGLGPAGVAGVAVGAATFCALGALIQLARRPDHD